MHSKLWPYITPGIPDELFERLPGIPLSKREIRLLLIAHLRLLPNSVLWDIGAGTGTIPVEIGLLCPQAQIIAVERDEEVANLIRRNCDRFEVNNVEVIEGSAPECLKNLQKPPTGSALREVAPLKLSSLKSGATYHPKAELLPQLVILRVYMLSHRALLSCKPVISKWSSLLSTAWRRGASSKPLLPSIPFLSSVVRS